jgi:hypothetical protein
MTSNYPESDPRHHTANVERMLDDLTKHLREDVAKFEDAKAKVLFETSAEVLIGLKKAFTDFDSGKEDAMQ